MSETGEYIMGQVRSMALIVADTKLHHRSGNKGMVASQLEQLQQEIEFLYSMLKKHPPYSPSRK